MSRWSVQCQLSNRLLVDFPVSVQNYIIVQTLKAFKSDRALFFVSQFGDVL